MKCEKSEIATCTADDIKVLLFIRSLRSTEDALVLEKLLLTLEDIETARAAAADPNTVPRLKLNEVCKLAKRLSSLKVEKTMVQHPETTSKNEILAVFKQKQDRKQQQRQSKPKPDRRSNSELSLHQTTSMFAAAPTGTRIAHSKNITVPSAKIRATRLDFVHQ